MTVNKKSIEDRGGLTIGDVRAFLGSLDALEGMTDDTLLTGRVTMSGKVCRLTADSAKRKPDPPRHGDHVDFPKPS